MKRLESMSSDEQLQVQKDTLWEIREQRMVVACLEKQIDDHFERVAHIRKLWEGRKLTALAVGLMEDAGDGQVKQLPTLRQDWSEKIAECMEARGKLADLENRFQQIVGGPI